MPYIRSYRLWVSLAYTILWRCITWLMAHKRLVVSLLLVLLVCTKFVDLPAGPGDGPGWP